MSHHPLAAPAPFTVTLVDCRARHIAATADTPAGWTRPLLGLNFLFEEVAITQERTCWCLSDDAVYRWLPDLAPQRAEAITAYLESAPAQGLINQLWDLHTVGYNPTEQPPLDALARGIAAAGRSTADQEVRP